MQIGQKIWSRPIWPFVVVVCLLSLLSQPSRAQEDNLAPPTDQAYPLSHTFPSGKGNFISEKGAKKLDRRLIHILSQISDKGISRTDARSKSISTLSNPFVRLKPNGDVQVYVKLSELSEDRIRLLEALEMKIELVENRNRIVQGWAPFDRVEQIANLHFVEQVTPPTYARVRTGSVTTEGDKIIRADAARDLGFDGRGTKVGVISDGANSWREARSTGDLPNTLTQYGTCSRRPSDPSSCDPGWTCNEGTALLEIIHDIAPGAQLAIGAATTSAEFIQRVDQLVNEFGADVIIDDLGFFGEPFFEDGPIAEAVAAVTDQVVFVSAAGNSADGHYEANFVGTSYLDVFAHDFGTVASSTRDPTMDITVPPGDGLFLVLQWNDRFGASSNDYDLYLIDKAEKNLLCPFCFSNSYQTGFQDPLEALFFCNDTNKTQTGKIVIDRFSGTTRRLELFVLGRRKPQYNISAGGVFGHPAVPDVLAVGAIDAADPGNDTIQPYSSLGPARIDFPSLRIRPKPDITGIDGVSVSGAGGFPNIFLGTSAAAPHVAGAAALILDKSPGAGAGKIRETLTAAAFDLGKVGRDNTYGYGRADVLAAIESLKGGVANPAIFLLLD